MVSLNSGDNTLTLGVWWRRPNRWKLFKNIKIHIFAQLPEIKSVGGCSTYLNGDLYQMIPRFKGLDIRKITAKIRSLQNAQQKLLPHSI